MNPITFNEPFEHGFATYPIRKVCEPFKNWQRAPLFDYSTTYEHEKEAVVSTLKTSINEMPWPFETFRLALAETAVPWRDDKAGGQEIGHGRYVTHYVAVRDSENNVDVAAQVREMWDAPETRKIKPQRFTMLITDIVRDEDGPEGAYKYNFSFAINGKWVQVLDGVHTLANELATAAMSALVSFLSDAMSPSTHIAEVKPAHEHKSVEWVKARTHYTLISHGHPANRKEVAEGESVATDRKGELTRMAHNRRSHYKTLRHERFRFARGKRIWVKACWVGPKEWRDEGGKQIYRILEPINENLTAAI